MIFYSVLFFIYVNIVQKSSFHKTIIYEVNFRNDYGKFLMVGCPVSGRVVNECSWYPFSIVQVFFNTKSYLQFFINYFCITTLIATFMDTALFFNWGCKNTLLF